MSKPILGNDPFSPPSSPPSGSPAGSPSGQAKDTRGESGIRKEKNKVAKAVTPKATAKIKVAPTVPIKAEPLPEP